MEVASIITASPAVLAIQRSLAQKATKKGLYKVEIISNERKTTSPISFKGNNTKIDIKYISNSSSRPQPQATELDKESSLLPG